MFTDRIFPQNRYIKRCKAENDVQSLKGKHVLIIGGTQGIGAGFPSPNSVSRSLFCGASLTYSCCTPIREPGM